MNKIRISRDNFKLDDIELTHGDLSIGRESDNNLHFDHPNISGHHAKIVTLFDSSHVEDLGSTNSTYVNGKPITIHTLHDGDIITIADYRIMFSSDARQAQASDHQETMILNSDDLMKRLKESESAKQHEHSILPETSATKPRPQQTADRPKPSIDELEFLSKMQEKLQKNGHNTVDKNVVGNNIQQHDPLPTHNADEPGSLSKVKEKRKQSEEHKKDSTKAKITQRPVLHTSREELFMRKEEKKKLLSPVTVYILTVSSICIVALLILLYLTA